MKKFEIEKLMRSSGFTPERNVNHGTFWSDGITRLLVARPGNWGVRNERNLKSDVKRAVSKREAMNPVVSKEFPVSEREPKRIIVNPSPAKDHSKLAVSLVEVTTAKENRGKTVSLPEAPKAERVPAFTTYDDETKDRIGLRVIELFEEGLTHAKIADALNRDGLKTSGGTPFNGNNVAQWCKRLGLTRYDTRAPKTPPGLVAVKPEPKEERMKVVPETKRTEVRVETAALLPPIAPPPAYATILNILKDPTIPDSRKVKTLLALLDE